MKKICYTSSFLLITSLLLNSCATDRSIAQRIAEFENTQANDATCFVQLNDGTVKYYNNLKLVTGLFNSPHLLADGNTRINASEIKAYQDRDHYAISQKLFVKGKRSSVALETLPGFAVRVVKGRVNVYCRQFFNGVFAADEYYLQAGDNGEIKVYSPELMNTLLRNDPTAFEFYNINKAKNKMPEKLLEAVKLYNNDQLVSRN